MTESGDPKPARKPRTDARRNRDLLIAAARAAFAAKGSAASLEEVAKAAGVGIGTLYRHFPTRDALIEAVYRRETEQLVAAAEILSAAGPPVEALRGWLRLFVDYLAVKRGMSEVLGSLGGGPAGLYAASSAQMQRALARLVDRAGREIRLEIEPLDLLRAIAGVAHNASGPGWEPAARRLVDILIDGLRPR